MFFFLNKLTLTTAELERATLQQRDQRVLRGTLSVATK